MSNNITHQIMGLKDKSMAELREQYQALYQKPSLSNATRRKLQMDIAYRLQELAYGGLSKQAKEKLERISKGEEVIACKKHGDLLPGTILKREWQGEMHKVEVITSGFSYRGKKYNALSPIAHDITGTKWNGKRFFKL